MSGIEAEEDKTADQIDAMAGQLFEMLGVLYTSDFEVRFRCDLEKLKNLELFLFLSNTMCRDILDMWKKSKL